MSKPKTPAELVHRRRQNLLKWLPLLLRQWYCVGNDCDLFDLQLARHNTYVLAEMCSRVQTACQTRQGAERIRPSNPYLAEQLCGLAQEVFDGTGLPRTYPLP